MALMSFVVGLVAASATVLASASVKSTSLVNVFADGVAGAYIQEIEKNFHIDADTPPFYEWGGLEEPACFQYVYQCSSVFFHLQNYFINGTVRAFYIPHTNHQNTNLLGEETTMTVTESTAVALATTEGWTAGARLSVSGDGHGVRNNVEISGSYSSSASDTTTKTKTISTVATCRKGYACEVQTWTFHVHIDGQCRTRPYINCGGQEYACQPDRDYSCAQLSKYQEMWCSAERRRATMPCSASMVLRNAAGEPLTKLVLISTRMAADNGTADARRDAAAENVIVEFLD